MDVDDCNGQSNISGSANFITDIFSVKSILNLTYFISAEDVIIIIVIIFNVQLVETLQWKESFLEASGVQQ